MNATNNEKLVPISSPDENKKDTYVFGLVKLSTVICMLSKNMKDSKLHSTGFTYNTSEMRCLKNRSPRVLRVASHIDEEEQTEKIWTGTCKQNMQ